MSCLVVSLATGAAERGTRMSVNDAIQLMQELPVFTSWNEKYLTLLNNEYAINEKIRKIEDNGDVDPKTKEYLLSKLYYHFGRVRIALNRHYDKHPDFLILRVACSK